MEPSVAVLNAYNHPSIAFLAQNPEILLKAYHQYPREKTLDIFMNYSYGAVNTFSAPKAMVFQKATKIFSYTIWLVFPHCIYTGTKKISAIKPATGAEQQDSYIPDTTGNDSSLLPELFSTGSLMPGLLLIFRQL